MYSSWTVFYNMSIASLLGAAGYIGAGEDSVFAQYQASQPDIVVAPIVAVAEIAPKATTPGAYVPVIDIDEDSIVLASFVADAPVVEAPVVSPLVLNTVVVSGETVNLRLGPSTDFDKIGAVFFGEELVLTGVTEGTWVQVQHPVDGSPVWISQKFIN